MHPIKKQEENSKHELQVFDLYSNISIRKTYFSFAESQTQNIHNFILILQLISRKTSYSIFTLNQGQIKWINAAQWSPESSFKSVEFQTAHKLLENAQ